MPSTMKVYCCDFFVATKRRAGATDRRGVFGVLSRERLEAPKNSTAKKADLFKISTTKWALLSYGIRKKTVFQPCVSGDIESWWYDEEVVEDCDWQRCILAGSHDCREHGSRLQNSRFLLSWGHSQQHLQPKSSVNRSFSQLNFMFSVRTLHIPSRFYQTPWFLCFRLSRPFLLIRSFNRSF